jgi:hypothetical protein
MSKAAAQQPTTNEAPDRGYSEETHLRRVAKLLARVAAAQFARQERGE